MTNQYAINVRVKEREPIRTFMVHAGDAGEARKKVLTVIERETGGKEPVAIDIMKIGA